MKLISLKGNEEFTITLYEQANDELKSDLLLVKNEETKKVIQCEIDTNNEVIARLTETIKA